MITTIQALKDKLYDLRENGESFSKARLGVGQEFVSIIQVANEVEGQNSFRQTPNQLRTKIPTQDTATAR
jgi:hypothetical protein